MYQGYYWPSAYYIYLQLYLEYVHTYIYIYPPYIIIYSPYVCIHLEDVQEFPEPGAEYLVAYFTSNKHDSVS